MKSIRFWKPLGLRRRCRAARPRSCWPTGTGLLAVAARSASRPGRRRRASGRRSAPRRRGSGRPGSATLANGGRFTVALLRPVPPGVQVGEQRRALIGERLQLASSSGGPGGGSRGTSAGPPRGRRCARRWPAPAIAALWKKPVMWARLSRERLQHRVAVARQAGELLVLLRRGWRGPGRSGAAPGWRGR